VTKMLGLGLSVIGLATVAGAQTAPVNADSAYIQESLKECAACLDTLISFQGYNDPGCQGIRTTSYSGEAGFFTTSKRTDAICHPPGEYKAVLENWCNAWAAKGSNCITDVQIAPLATSSPHPANVSTCTANRDATANSNRVAIAGGPYVTLTCGHTN
jgi:hypothetical protein